MFGPGAVDLRLAALATRRYGATFLCAPDFPFVQDGTRQDVAFQRRGHAYYVDELARAGIAYEDVHGSVAARVARVAAALRGLSAHG
jgi:nicotinamide riboside kinase